MAENSVLGADFSSSSLSEENDSDWSGPIEVRGINHPIHINHNTNNVTVVQSHNKFAWPNRVKQAISFFKTRPCMA